MDNIKGLGLVRLIKLLDKFKIVSVKGIFTFLRKSFKEASSLLDLAEDILTVFNHQIVYDPNTDKLRYLNITSNGCTLDEFYTGSFFANYKKFVRADIDIDTMESRPKSKVNYERMIKFLNCNLGSFLLLRNMCNKEITYENFDIESDTEYPVLELTKKVKNT